MTHLSRRSAPAAGVLVVFALGLSSCGSAASTHSAADAAHVEPPASTARVAATTRAAGTPASGAPSSQTCAATAAATLGHVAARIYHTAATSEDVAQAVHRVQSSPALAEAIAAGNSSTARAALRALLLNQIVAIQVLRRGHPFAGAGAGPAIAPVRGTIPGTGASFVLSVQADHSYLEVARQVTGAQILLLGGAHRTRRLAGTFAGPPGASVPAGGALSYRGASYQVSSAAGTVYPSGALRIAVLAPSSALSCPSSAPPSPAQVRVETLGKVGQRIYQEELHSPVVTATVRLLERSSAFIAAAAHQDAAAAREAIVGFFRAHIHVVRVRLTVGSSSASQRLLVDVGGPYVLAPVHGTLRSDGRTVGAFTMAIQDDAGYLKLARLFTGAQVLMRVRSHQVIGTLSPGPASVPDRGQVSYGGRTYAAYSFTGQAFPSGPLRISLLLHG